MDLQTDKLSSSTDMELVASMKSGDSRAVSTLYDRHARVVYSLALRILQISTDAEEVTQDTFFQMWQQADRIDQNRGSVLAWLVMVARSRAIDRLRSRRKLRVEISDEGLDNPNPFGVPSAWEEIESGERSSIVERALREIPAEQREVLHLGYHEGMSQSEIAERLKEPIGTIKTRVRLGMKKLRQSLAALVGDYESRM